MTEAFVSDLEGDLTDNNHTVYKTGGGDSRRALKLGLGYRYNDYFALELGYADLGEVDVNAEGVTPDENDFAEIVRVTHPETADGWTYAGTVSLPIPKTENWYIHGRIGIFDWKSEYETHKNDQYYSTDTYEDKTIFYGIGVSYRKYESWGARLEYEKYKLDQENVYLLTLGLTYDF